MSELSKEAKAYMARRKTKPMTDAEIAAIVEAELPGDRKLGVRLHKAIVARQKAWKLYGYDEGRERFETELNQIRAEREKERNANV